MAKKGELYHFNVCVDNGNDIPIRNYKIKPVRHPSESEIRFLAKILAFCCYAQEGLQFTRGLCVDDEPELWVKSAAPAQDPQKDIKLWIDLGEPAIKRIKKAAKISQKMVVFSYHPQKFKHWFQHNYKQLHAIHNLTLHFIPPHILKPLQSKLLIRRAELIVKMSPPKISLNWEQSQIEWNLTNHL